MYVSAARSLLLLVAEKAISAQATQAISTYVHVVSAVRAIEDPPSLSVSVSLSLSLSLICYINTKDVPVALRLLLPDSRRV